MISSEILNEMRDDELQTTIEQATKLLKQRDEDRKAKAIVDARAMQAKASNEARVILEAAGLSLKDLNGKGKRRAAKPATYHTGHTYQHPVNKALLWNGKGKKPGWLRIDRKPHSNARGVMVRPSAIGSEETIQHEGHRLEPESDIKPHSRGPRLVSEEDQRKRRTVSRLHGSRDFVGARDPKFPHAGI